MGTSGIFKPDTAEPECLVAKSQKSNNDRLVSGCPVAKRGAGERGVTPTLELKSDGLPYQGPVLPVPDLGPDPLDDHGVPLEVGLSSHLIRKLGSWYREQHSHRRNGGASLSPEAQASLNGELRRMLHDEGVLPEFLNVEFWRVVDEACRT
jgi:hypothetical protein